MKKTLIKVILFSILAVFQLSTAANSEQIHDAQNKAGSSIKKIAYITIDDGPSRGNTPKILDTLKTYGIKATFFVLPKNDMDDLYKRIIDEGHVLGNHTYSHNPGCLYASPEKFRNEVIKARNFIYEKFGYISTVFRFPGGTIKQSKKKINEKAGILAELGYDYFDWNVSVADTDPNLKKNRDEEQIVNLLAQNVINKTGNRKRLIILMHDSSDKIYTVKALPIIIEGLEKLGYTFDVLTNYKPLDNTHRLNKISNMSIYL